jgi:hypothetical protein
MEGSEGEFLLLLDGRLDGGKGREMRSKWPAARLEVG